MKLRIFLLLSILANAALVAAYLGSKRPADTAQPTVVQPITNTVTRIVTEQRAARPVVITETNGFQWRDVESQDYREYIAKLRSIGCPEETIRDIIIADVNKLYAGRVAALYPAAKDFEFWKSNDRQARAVNRQREQKERELENEKVALVKELLGVELEQELAKWSGRPDDDDRRYGFLPAEKQEQLKALQEKYRTLERSVSDQSGGGSNAENRAKLVALRAQREAEMAQLLSPAEYEQYQMRNSWTARNMRDNLAGFEPSESEFRSVFQMRKAFDDQYGLIREGNDETVREQRRVAQQQLDEQIKATLGEQRYKDYQLAQDERYRDLYEFTQRNNLPKETAETVYEVRKLAEAERKKLASDQTIRPEERTAMLKMLAEETKTAVSSSIGSTHFNNYLRRDGEWLERLGQNESNRGDRNRGQRDRFSRQ